MFAEPTSVFVSEIIMWTKLTLVAEFFIFLPFQAGRCAYVILIMAVYWMTEAIPIAATALIPVAVMPWLGIMGSKDLCMNYLKVSWRSNNIFFAKQSVGIMALKDILNLIKVMI